MAGRKRTRPDDAKVVSISLGGAVRLVLSTIEVRRKQRSEQGDTSSQIVADALWHYLDTIEKVPREDIEKLLIAPKSEASNVRAFPKK
jgi:hypothetical protein